MLVMNLLDYFKTKKEEPTPAASSETAIVRGNDVIQIVESNVLFDGEKSLGELGAPIILKPDYAAIRNRAYSADLRTNVIRLISGKFFKWVIGSGLKLQVELDQEILNLEGFKGLDYELIKTQAEKRFNLFAYSKRADYSGMKNFHGLALDAYKTAWMGGDCLVVYRIDEKTHYPTCQVIDGQEVVNPDIFSKFYKDAEKAGNRIISGVEVDRFNSHVAFYVRSENAKGEYDIERIPAKIEGFNFVFARMIYIRKHRINDVRGVSTIVSILERIDKLDRYTEATVSGAEERANIAYYVKHDKDSTGENPLNNPLLKKISSNAGVQTITDPYSQGEKIADNIARTTNKMALNMPVGSDLEKLGSDSSEINYKDFFTPIFEEISASMDTPPEVAMQKYSSNYSASRAAINGWEYMIGIDRDKFSEEFYQPFYELFFYTQVLKGKISAGTEYLKAVKDDDFMVVDAFTNARFIGAKMPHIDPLKEVNAMRKLLGTDLDHVPITSLDQASEAVNVGDFNENYKKLKKEMQNNSIEFKSEGQQQVDEQIIKKEKANP